MNNVKWAADWRCRDPYQEITPDNWTANLGFTEHLIDEAQAALGPRLLLQNNSLRDVPPTPDSPYGRLCRKMRDCGVPFGFQTIGNQRIDSLHVTIETGIALGASYFEVYGVEQRSKVNTMGKVDFAALNRRLRENR